MKKWILLQDNGCLYPFISKVIHLEPSTVDYLENIDFLDDGRTRLCEKSSYTYENIQIVTKPVFATENVDQEVPTDNGSLDLTYEELQAGVQWTFEKLMSEALPHGTTLEDLPDDTTLS